MSDNLYIIDLSSFAHAGAVNKYSFIEGPIQKEISGWRSFTCPTGGASLILTSMLPHLESDFLVCCDRNPTIKKEMLPTYKNNRQHKREIEVQKTIAERILQDIGVPLLYKDGYEADDFIYSAVQAYKGMYKHIYVLTGDSDLYFLVDDNVTILPSNSRAKTVTRENFEYTVVKNQMTPYNTLTMSKIMGGDTSDCIPPLPVELRQHLYYIFIQGGARAVAANKKHVRDIVAARVPEALSQVDLVFPLDVEVPLSVECHIDPDKLVAWGKAVKNKRFNNYASTYDVRPKVKELIEEGLYVD